MCGSTLIDLACSIGGGIFQWLKFVNFVFLVMSTTYILTEYIVSSRHFGINFPVLQWSTGSSFKFISMIFAVFFHFSFFLLRCGRHVK